MRLYSALGSVTISVVLGACATQLDESGVPTDLDADPQGGAAGSSSSAGTGGSFVCDPPAEPGSIWEKTAEAYAEVDPVSMCKYRGKVLLIFNSAAL